MDNAIFHKRVQKLLNRHGHRLLFLPPYSLDLNPIEKKWAQVNFLRQGWMDEIHASAWSNAIYCLYLQGIKAMNQKTALFVMINTPRRMDAS